VLGVELHADLEPCHERLLASGLGRLAPTYTPRVLAIVGGLVAALLWGTATVSSSRASRDVGATSTLAGVMLVGFVVAVPIALVAGVPHDLRAVDIGWLAVSGGGNVLGLLLEYRGLRLGKVGVVAAIASTEGALTALIAIGAGERVSLVTGVLLAFIAVGVVLASIAPDDPGAARERRVAVAALYGFGAAVAFAVSLYATARVGKVVSVPWVLVAARVAGVLAIAVPALATGRLRLGRQVAPVTLSGLCELGGFAAFTFGSRHSIAVSAVLASQFAAVAATGAYLVFRERLARVQFVGVATIVVGVAILAGVRT
jgi:drug/metabolite transporter (DMT)-like permease